MSNPTNPSSIGLIFARKNFQKKIAHYVGRIFLMYLHLSPSENNAALERLNTRAFTKIQKWDAVQEYMKAGGYSCAEIVVRGPSSPKESCRCLVSFHGCWNEVLTYANKYVSIFCLLSLINIFFR